MPEPAPLRLDAALVERGLARDLKEARALVLAGQVLSGDTLLDQPAQPLEAGSPLRVRGRRPFASRAGAKLEAALEAGGIEVAGLHCLDLGASSGGFTDCLLKRGAASVLAVELGRNQLDWRLRSDPRVSCRESTDYRSLGPGDLPPALGFACADLSFTSVKPLFPYLAAWLPAAARWAVLVKPQFEVAASELGAGGVLRAEGPRLRVLQEAEAAAAAAGLQPQGRLESPLAGAKGNREWLLWGRARP